MKCVKLILLCVVLFFTSACTQSPEPINYGKDACAHCKMTIVDNRFGAELVTAKGKIYKFDDIICLRHFEKEHPEQKENRIFVSDYRKEHRPMLEGKDVIFLRHGFFRSPMNGQYAAFASREEAQALADSLKVAPVSLKDVN